MGKVTTVGIIDDDKFYSTIVSRQLERANMQVMFNASDGKCGLAELQSMLIHPKVVIVDIEMPIMDGFEVVRYLKQAWPRLPIIAHSSLTSDTVHQQIIADGADMFILKQPNALKLIDAIKKLTAIKVS
ncbi:CheY-like chemotaxis protein [Mucilaginibacter gracilis]|uniref:CheY-like chemotaxis protein n=2 Tax=Mucilaginibacter gracilis TaxID=423350 RepID=A0A495IYC3_9SPHI|nr:CheY-like chemotaxis protein [Mucilaginibacter gracilis]